jgi:hypothetical protein
MPHNNIYHSPLHRLQDITTFTSEDAASTIKRLGLVLYRMAMIFTTLRKFENAEAAEQVQCTDID